MNWIILILAGLMEVGFTFILSIVGLKVLV